MHQQNKHKLWAFLRRWVNSLYVVAFAFIVIAVILFLLPELKGPIWQIIGGALLGAGFTILVTTITAQQSIHEQYKKEANLQRKTDVYGPLHEELKELREAFDEAHAGIQPYPLWIKVTGKNFQPSLYQTDHTPPTFSYWPSFKKNYHVDDFTDSARKLLDDVQSCIRTYNEAAQVARQVTQNKLRQRLNISIRQVEKSPQYQEWLQKRNQIPRRIPHRTPRISNPWFEFIEELASSSGGPLASDEPNSWVIQTFGWLLANRVDHAAKEVYEGDIKKMEAFDLIAHSWFLDLFEATLNDLKCEQAYRLMMHSQDKLFKKLLEAEKKLKDGMIEIRERYQGGSPHV